jgi:hypothetical protein
MTNYSPSPGHVQAFFFKPNGKRYMEEMLDMSEDYSTRITPIDAVLSALRRTERGRGFLEKGYFHIFVPEPYHEIAYPVMIPSRDVMEDLAEEVDGIAATRSMAQHRPDSPESYRQAGEINMLDAVMRRLRTGEWW